MALEKRDKTVRHSLFLHGQGLGSDVGDGNLSMQQKNAPHGIVSKLVAVLMERYQSDTDSCCETGGKLLRRPGEGEVPH